MANRYGLGKRRELRQVEITAWLRMSSDDSNEASLPTSKKV
jgi:hypothetical protein